MQEDEDSLVIVRLVVERGVVSGGTALDATLRELDNVSVER
jgi:hypothetical protein